MLEYLIPLLEVAKSMNWLVKSHSITSLIPIPYKLPFLSYNQPHPIKHGMDNSNSKDYIPTKPAYGVYS